MVARPFFCSPPTERIPKRRLLLLSYHFPPGTAVGALRWQKMASFAAARGWSIDGIVLDPSSLPSADRAQLEELPHGVRLFGVPRPVLVRDRMEHLIWRVYRWARPRRPPRESVSPASRLERGGDGRARQPTIRGWANPAAWKRAYYAWCEHGRDGRWASEAAGLARELLREGSYDAILTCGPPHMVHSTGQRLGSEAGIPSVMDLRDPWSLVERVPDYYDSPVWFWLARRHERQAVAGASLVVMNSERAAQAMRQAYPDRADRIITIMNGCDDDEPIPAPSSATRFLIVFAGSIYIDRNPRLLFRAAAQVVRQLDLTDREFRIEFVGNVGSVDPDDPTSLLAVARAEGLAGYVSVSGFRPRRELAALLAEATVLVSLYQDSQMAIPSKIFQYMQYDAWVLTFAETGSATELLLRGSDADVVDPLDVDTLVHTLIRRYRQFATGQRPVRLARDHRFSRRAQATRLLDRLEALCPGARSPENPVGVLARGD